MKLPTLWIAASFSLLAACSNTVATVETPALIPYSEKFQTRAAAEKRALPPPCHRQTPSGDCSTLRTLVDDYFLTRQRIRAAKDQ